jgi:3-polyprenyl-4-hydroxybenzoate decarboxylase
VVGRLLDHLGLDHDLSHRWGQTAEKTGSKA